MSTTPMSVARNLLPSRLFSVLTDNATVLVGAMLLSAILRFGSNLILTRLLLPEAFGIMLIIGSISFSLVLLSETGVAPYLIRTQGAAGRRVLDVLWTVQVVRGAILFLILLLMAPYLADALGKPEATNPLRLASVTLLIDGARSLRPMVVRREGRERRNAVIELGVYLAYLPILIGLAWVTRSYWGLVIGLVVSSTMTCAATYLLYKASWHRFAWSGRTFASLWRFSRYILASSMITAVVMQFDKIFVAGTFPLREAGLYAMAWNLALVGDTITNSYFGRVYFPAAAKRLRRERPSPESFYEPMSIVRPLVIFACSAGVTFGEAFFRIAFDPNYLLSGTFFTVLTLKPLFGTFAYSTGNYLTAAGHTRPKLVSDLIRMVYLPSAAIIGYRQFGVFGLLWAVALIDVIPSVYQYSVVGRLGAFRPRDELLTLAAVPMGLATGAFLTWASRGIG